MGWGKICLIFLVLISVCGCTQKQHIPMTTTLSCTPPYIKVGNDCCLDEDNDNSCDRDKPTTSTLAMSTSSSTTSTLVMDSCMNVCRIKYDQTGECVRSGAECHSSIKHIEKDGNKFCKAESRVYDSCCCIKATPKEPETTTMVTLVGSYEVVSSEDKSIKAMDKSFSEYVSANEIAKLPTNIRKRYKIIVPSDVSKEQLKATLTQIVEDETSKNRDIDEIIIFAYGRKEDINFGVYTYGRVEWCPNGDWGGVTERIASSNDRSSYQYVFDIRDKVGAAQSGRPTERDFEIYTALDKALFAEPDTAEEIINKRIASQYGITETELTDIYIKVLVYQMT